ncbi:MAG: S-methyl-5-thioribose-1-phosphate isomerase [Deltaproteobacteria bacterium]|jgi:methylthioribose-1-phosphate isomerase|nr:S-methyl-5-thioribose-1-phosphate isomerase [Deltaproteobacteria bacterium]
MDIIKTIEWKDNKVIMLDQRRLPHEELYNTYEDYLGVAKAIKNMVIRGAPAIGVAAAMGTALGAMGIGVENFDEFFQKLSAICDRLGETRPTAVNLFWALARMKACAQLNKELPIPEIAEKLKEEALKIYTEDLESNHMIGRNGEKLLQDGMTVLTHCNAGALATAGFGTALGVIYSATNAGKRIHVIADETRPRLQGAMLTAWELQKHGIEVTVISDTMMGSLMKQREIDACIVGADRIAANGDVANKIGTYQVAVLANRHGVPFYVAAPLSTIDLDIKSGNDIPIEERDPKEVTHIGPIHITPDYVKIQNPAFDVTPAELITAIITEKGVVEGPYENSISKLFN